MVKEIKDLDYKKVVSENKKVVIDCYATWCGPCKMLSPVIDKLAEELSDVCFYKIDVDQAEIIVNDFQIMSIPTLLIFEDGKLKNKIIGLRSKDEIKSLIEE